jgi:hypothetical protein
MCDSFPFGEVRTRPGKQRQPARPAFYPVDAGGEADSAASVRPDRKNDGSGPTPVAGFSRPLSRSPPPLHRDRQTRSYWAGRRPGVYQHPGPRLAERDTVQLGPPDARLAADQPIFPVRPYGFAGRRCHRPHHRAKGCHLSFAPSLILTHAVQDRVDSTKY